MSGVRAPCTPSGVSLFTVDPIVVNTAVPVSDSGSLCLNSTDRLFISNRRLCGEHLQIPSRDGSRGLLCSSLGRLRSLAAVLAAPCFALATAPLSPTRPHSLTPPQPRRWSSASLWTTDSLARCRSRAYGPLTGTQGESFALACSRRYAPATPPHRVYKRSALSLASF